MTVPSEQVGAAVGCVMTATGVAAMEVAVAFARDAVGAAVLGTEVRVGVREGRAVVTVGRGVTIGGSGVFVTGM